MSETEKSFEAHIISPLQKVFLDEKPRIYPFEITALRGEKVSFQAAICAHHDWMSHGVLTVTSNLGVQVNVRMVENVPVAHPAHPETDSNYLRTAPGLYPDLLRPLHNGLVFLPAHQWRALWIEVTVDDTVPAGNHTVTIAVDGDEDWQHCTATATITVLDCTLEPASLIHTEWFYTDCIAAYYGIDVWSEAHWQAIEAFMRTAAERGINMILTPIHTPPLDTARGSERPTTQLVDVRVTDGEYSFNFDKLIRWVEIAQRVGIKYYEMAHLFTQWGADSAPKIMATVNGEHKRIFGWDTPAVDENGYTKFLHAYLPALTQKLRDLGIAEQCYFHISDEPGMGSLDAYRAALESVSAQLEGFKRMDALSDYEFYKLGLVPIPVPSNDHSEAFLEANVPNLWTYYCTAQHLEVSNRFMAMPSARNRAIGVQMYVNRIAGFLHWGYNCYTTYLSLMPIDPYAVTDAGGAFPGGDPFLVYPGKGLAPEESVRLLVLYQAQTDLRAMQQLERKKGRDFVLDLIGTEIGFKQYPHDDEFYINLRNRVNKELV